MEPIVIAGGCYFEACEAPHWRALYGSGGRAAQALIGQGPVALHTYFPKAREAELYPFIAAGIDVRAADSASALAFAYFHPLSDPVLAPLRSDIQRRPPIWAAGDAVLRFGFVEGEAIVRGRRVVYDPQSVGEFEPFGRNGSSAQELAVVLNAQELRAASRHDDLDGAARALVASGVEVVVAKCGVRGAFVHTRGRSSAWVPAFWSDSIFKIGTGDVFSAAFTYAWAHLGRDPVEAAHAASRCVSQYAASRVLPLPRPWDGPTRGRAIYARSDGQVHLVGSTARLADRWLCEEAAWRLQQLGVRVLRLDDPSGDLPANGAFLVLADQIEPAALAELARRVDAGRMVVLRETDSTSPEGVLRTGDFTTALYWSCWISSREPPAEAGGAPPERDAEQLG
ncbi:carbohydrate kinase family protein [Sphingomonas sp. FW199]|uniref:carbohydrate kinase family protein n=1 Tax=Sphingomonas sp. FW199 TaxID=3400217 RepID=UPI003CEAA8AD